jgi:hypothetical protein
MYDTPASFAMTRSLVCDRTFLADKTRIGPRLFAPITTASYQLTAGDRLDIKFKVCYCGIMSGLGCYCCCRATGHSQCEVLFIDDS